MQCSCCREERNNLRDYSMSAFDAAARKTILTLQLCPVCRIAYRIRPEWVVFRARPASARTSAIASLRVA